MIIAVTLIRRTETMILRDLPITMRTKIARVRTELLINSFQILTTLEAQNKALEILRTAGEEIPKLEGEGWPWK